mgnify:CR=1 FL=1
MNDPNSQVLSVDDVTKCFRRNTALDKATLHISSGEFVGLLGPNGAGKTTLIRAITGHVLINSGSIRLFGEPVRGRSRSRVVTDRLGAVPQNLALYPNLTARENLSVFGALYGVTGHAAKERAGWALNWADLEDRADEPIHNFSTGMKRRLNIACGILHEPAFILLDEPTVGVDPQARECIWQMLRTLQQNGATLLLTTHQLDEAETLCDRIIIIDHGKPIAQGSFDELVAHTIGSDRVIVIECPLDQKQAQLLPDHWTYDDCVIRIQVRDVWQELPDIIVRLQDIQTQIGNIHIKLPSLHDVFLHLTGRELRE